MKVAPAVGKWLYGALFVAVLPALLVLWARHADTNIVLAAVRSVPWGAAVAVAGFLAWASGVASLVVLGGGLPMNAYPPARLVTGGAYALLAHPIYVGVVLVCAGVSVAAGSVAGLWLVTPTIALGAAALWWGYERIDLRARFGPPRHQPLLAVPLAREEKGPWPQRLGAALLALAPPALLSCGLALGQGLTLVDLLKSYAVLLALAPLASRSRRDSRDLVVHCWFGTLLIALVMATPPRGPWGGQLPIDPGGALFVLSSIAMILALLRNVGLSGLLPPMIAISLGALLAALEQPPAVGSLLGAAVFAAAYWRGPIWRALLRSCERLAGSWREVEWHGLRIINIGLWAAAPTALGIFYAVVLAGPGQAATALGTVAATIVGSAVWAQLVEGSPAMARPYGFFGGLLGAILFALLAAPAIFHTSSWLVLGTWAAAAPWIQGLARLRCVANGCCHGSPCAPAPGIRYTHPRTRVVRLTQLSGTPLHPTQLYSLAGNIVIGVVVMRLWSERAPLAAVAGLYFLLMGLARFVEEAYRGEPQTPVHAGLRLYQWLAIACVLAGAVLTAIPDTPESPPPLASWAAVWAGLAAGALTWIATSVDFPGSSARFARLA